MFWPVLSSFYAPQPLIPDPRPAWYQTTSDRGRCWAAGPGSSLWSTSHLTAGREEGMMTETTRRRRGTRRTWAGRAGLPKTPAVRRTAGRPWTAPAAARKRRSTSGERRHVQCDSEENHRDRTGEERLLHVRVKDREKWKLMFIFRHSSECITS